MILLDIFETEGRYCLAAMIEEDMPDALFTEHELHGGGYTWEAILESLLAIHAPDIVDALQIGAEADNFFAYAESRGPLEKAAELLQAAATDPNMLLSAIEHAGDD